MEKKLVKLEEDYQSLSKKYIKETESLKRKVQAS